MSGKCLHEWKTVLSLFLIFGYAFAPRFKHAQQVRIDIVVEVAAFERIAEEWRRLGYPFEHLVPSLATSIGSSALTSSISSIGSGTPKSNTTVSNPASAHSRCV